MPRPVSSDSEMCCATIAATNPFATCTRVSNGMACAGEAGGTYNKKVYKVVLSIRYELLRSSLGIRCRAAAESNYIYNRCGVFSALLLMASPDFEVLVETV